jgi:hypothetical protein
MQFASAESDHCGDGTSTEQRQALADRLALARSLPREPTSMAFSV